MPNRIPTPCRKSGCPDLTTERHGYCDAHSQSSQFPIRRPQPSRSKPTRPSAYRRGYNTAWNKARLAFLRDHPICRVCADYGLLKTATVVDHIQPHKGSSELFWDMDNWQALCKRCHDRKTVSERDSWY